MWPLLVFSVTVTGIILERIVFFMRHDLGVRKIRDFVIEKIKTGEVDDAIECCNSLPGKTLSAGIFLEGIRLWKLGEHRMEKAMETEASERINTLEKGFNFLLAIGSIAPITGFLGTVSGMIQAFNSIANADDVNAQLVAGGIFEALITTAYGLSIAIVAVSSYYILVHLVDSFSFRIEEAGSGIITAIIVKTENQKRSL